MEPEPTESSSPPVPEPEPPSLHAVPAAGAASGVAPFPVEVLPEPLRRFVGEVAAAIDCPPDFAAVPMLAILGVAIGRSCTLEVKGNWREGARIYAAVIGKPSSGKSPALDLARRPLTLKQRDLRASYLSDVERFSEPPLMPQIYTTDSTVEALADLLEKNPRGIAFVADELQGWVHAMSQYKSGKGNDRAHWLSFWSGDDVIINRKGSAKARATPLFLDDPHVCLVGGLPPSELPDLISALGPHDGFAARFLFTYPEPDVPQTVSREEVSDEALEGYVGVWNRLWDRSADDTAGGAGNVLRFNSEAREAWFGYADQLQGELHRQSVPPELDGAWGKLDTYSARLALILHLARVAGGEANDDGEVDETSVRGAMALIDYFKSHARRVYACLDGKPRPDDQRRVRLLRYLFECGGNVTLRDVYNSKIAGCTDRAFAEQLARELEDDGWIDVSEQSNPGQASVGLSLRLGKKA